MKHFTLIIIALFCISSAWGQQVSFERVYALLDEYFVPSDGTEYMSDSIWNELDGEFAALLKRKEIVNYDFSDFSKKVNMRYDYNFKVVPVDNYLIYSLYAYPQTSLLYIAEIIKTNEVIDSCRIIVKRNAACFQIDSLYPLNSNEFLLVEHMDEMVYSCYYATIYENKGGVFQIKEDGFTDRSMLTVCTFTNLQDYNPENEEWYSYQHQPRAILYNTRTKVLSYSEDNTNKKKTSSTKYKNGKFKIEDSDERTFYD